MFIPNKSLKIGDRIVIKEDLQVLAGIFTRGHEFTITDITERGPDLMDDDGNVVLETAFSVHTMEKI